MASTRNKNTPGNYCLEQKQYTHSRTYTLYPNSQYGAAYDTKLPGNGLNPGQIPGNKMSYNAPDIESFLFGIMVCHKINVHNSPIVHTLHGILHCRIVLGHLK